MDTLVDPDISKQGISTDERTYLCQIFDNIADENLAVSDSHCTQVLRENRKL